MTEKNSSDGNYDESLNFGGGEPGASRHGNFINYYKFHPAEERVEQLPRGVWQSCYSDRKFIALDVGCNAGVSLNFFFFFPFLCIFMSVSIYVSSSLEFNGLGCIFRLERGESGI